MDCNFEKHSDQLADCGYLLALARADQSNKKFVQDVMDRVADMVDAVREELSASQEADKRTIKIVLPKEILRAGE